MSEDERAEIVMALVVEHQTMVAHGPLGYPCCRRTPHEGLCPYHRASADGAHAALLAVQFAADEWARARPRYWAVDHITEVMP